MFKGRGLKVFLGGCVAYGGMASYVQLRTKYLIDERSREKLLQSPEFAQSAASHFTRTMMVAGRYVNPFYEYRPQTVFEFVYCRIIETFHTGPRGGVPINLSEIRNLLPAVTPTFDLLEQIKNRKSPYYNFAGRKLLEPATLTWFGQSTALVQLDGLNILTDPCFGDHLVSKTFGPRRISPPPCDIQDLPPIDYVLVSHDHPDHFEYESVQHIGNSATWIVPIGVGERLLKLGVTNYKELDWWQTTTLKGNKSGADWDTVCTPAMHWSGRNMIDSNQTLWCSFMVRKNKQSIFYHAGDTGYSEALFQSIGSVLGPCKMAMIPCGAYTPRWHLRPQHTDPADALLVKADIGASKVVGVHWGTFVLSDEYFLEPRDLLHKLAEDTGVGNDVIAPEFGRTILFDIGDAPDNHQKRITNDCIFMG